MFYLFNLVLALENNILPGQERSEEPPSGGGEIRTRPVQLSATTAPPPPPEKTKDVTGARNLPHTTNYYI